ncbi:hypothetical protein M409DRAFT_22312 [Zasmidium cellare ATCC 36951]|uniref:Uncharacterized protein n=1 Tax=Zasmidium cellare ATCC 36951 TaxID=1080233 RepID=A0A6A6CJV0_ZASCE|nr:uncharacterized protein M409DRAFT_22312 [Zasmidium cellare ATCC 36951]KAF2167504.1 hypothetical protein M409DRAFT_22312 [Zasmidium cellare ATCC 36951]
MQRAASLREWSEKSTGLWLKLNSIQNQWRLLAGQYVGLPLAFRRDMTLGKWSERFTCAAVLQHIAAYPAILSDPNVYKMQQLAEMNDQFLSDTETCIVSRGWYAMLHEAASTMRHWQDISDNEINPQRIVALLDQGEAAVQAMEVMLQTLLSTYCSAEATPRPDRMMTRAWNTMCSDIRWGAALEKAAAKFTWEVQTTSQPPSNGGRRVWVNYEVALPPEAASEGTTLLQSAAVTRQLLILLRSTHATQRRRLDHQYGRHTTSNGRAHLRRRTSFPTHRTTSRWRLSQPVAPQTFTPQSNGTRLISSQATLTWNTALPPMEISRSMLGRKEATLRLRGST